MVLKPAHYAPIRHGNAEIVMSLCGVEGKPITVLEVAQATSCERE